MNGLLWPKHIYFFIAFLLFVLVVPTSCTLSTPWELASGATSNLEPVQYVDPFIGTDPGTRYRAISGFAGGHVFPGADFPHGMVQWSPDTTKDPGGYRYSQSSIYGFSLTHFSGRGCRSYQDFPFMPTVGPMHVSPANSTTYAASFSHANETASPGYYSVHLDRTNIQVALTVTARTGFGQFTYPPSQNATLLINAGGSATGNANSGTGVQIVGSNQVVGLATSGHFCGQANTYTLYFAATFDTPFTSFGTWNGPTLTPASRTSNGNQSGAYLVFDTTHHSMIQVRVGLSFVSIANAQTNLAKENPNWNFQTVRNKASTAWNTSLGVIQVSGGTTEQQRIFYTALYHTLIHPNVFSDVNGQYLGFDHKVHVAQGYTQYENFPGWDMYRSLIGLLALLDPQATSDMMQSLVADAQQGGGGMPRWEVANDNSGGMVGDSPDAIIATSYAFGARNFGVNAALHAMDLGASDPHTHSGKYVTREGLTDYLKLGYVPTRIRGSAAITLEYTTDDFALAQFAKALGNTSLYTTYLQRSHNWQHLFNAQSGYIEPRNPDGTFLAHFNPTSQDGFVESNGLQYSWMVPYDLPDLFAAMGGNAKVVARLDNHFTQLNAGPASRYAFMGNEPEFEVPWEYDFAGSAYRTQDVIQRIETQLFLATPDGLPGNDDGGAMSSWYVFAALGLYPEIPGVAGFALGSPLFPTITVHLGNGHTLSIQSSGVSATAYYIQSLKVNGQSYTSAWLPFGAIMNGATLQYTMGSQPDMNWGR
ncbi:MAG TPA: GH92 family glycosyl hydrolase [Ktedonobacteraceae bacterium]|nr:GH92 family glycosyl hydrolase [Ktedonobacteraceae bacterium]